MGVHHGAQPVPRHQLVEVGHYIRVVFEVFARAGLKRDISVVIRNAIALLDLSEGDIKVSLGV